VSTLEGTTSRYTFRVDVAHPPKRESLSVILTVDQADFATYRIEGKRQFRVLPGKRP